MSPLRTLSVIVPVFNAAADLERCMIALDATLPAGTAVLVIDDASFDPAAVDVLERWRERRASEWQFLRNERNLGFVATANRGLRATQGDVVLLNSDTVPAPGWHEALRRCLAADPAIGTATPWTNNGEIASLPEFCAANPVPPDLAAVAAGLRAAGPPCYPELPTAVGFCMAIARDAVERVGLLDEEAFGRGYGEENDFSLRVSEAGMRNVLCDDAYVAHTGGRSFGPLGLRPGPDSMERLLARHPGYLERVEAFIGADPLAPRRAAVLEALDRAGVAMG
jgi:GT2 family glycosyltransferase